MFNLPKSLCAAALTLACACAFAQTAKVHYGLGTPITNDDLKGFTSSLPDGRDLPPGQGSVAQGKTIYQNQCAACHGANLEGGVGDRLIGGRGTLVNSDPTKKPVKTVESYWPYATTLFDYIKRAMPLTAPGSLTNDEVYAVAAYILSQGHIIGPDATLDAASLAKVKMPNRDGFIPDPRPEKFPPAGRAAR
jgi:cytochrome c